MAEILPDADVLRVLELHFGGANRKRIQQQTQLDDFDVHHIITRRKNQPTQRVLAKYPEWSAKHQQHLQDNNSRSSNNNNGNGNDNASNPASESGVSEYEAKRLQRVRENQAAMLALGMQKLRPKRAPSTTPSRMTELREAARKNPRRSSRISSVGGAPHPMPPTTPPRASHYPSRGAKATVPLYQELDLPIVDLNAPSPPPPAAASREAKQAQPPAKRQRVSSQQLGIDFESFHARWLGNQIWPRGKQTIMQGMCPSHTPMFSKMSGVQAWTNAVVLFVNVQGESQYDNVFHQMSPPTNQDEEEEEAAYDEHTAPVYFQWFAQYRHHMDSPVIKRMLNAEKGDASLRIDDASYYQQQQSGSEPAGAPRDPVLLFIRHVDGPYIYCGRLGFLGVRAGSSPLEFRWQLLDVAALAWTKIKALIESSGEQVDGAAVVEDKDE